MRLLRGCGLGDTILLLGAAVWWARKVGKMRILTSPDYYHSINDMLVNHPEVEAFTVENEASLPKDGVLKIFDSAGGSVISRLEGSPPLWYEEMGVPFSERWNSSPVPDACASIAPSDIAPVFVHDDASRGFFVPVNGYRPAKTKSLMDHVPALKGAREIHCMDSSIFNLVESMDQLPADLFYYPDVKGPYPYSLKRHKWNFVKGSGNDESAREHAHNQMWRQGFTSFKDG